jgi:hypothetical protein
MMAWVTHWKAGNYSRPLSEMSKASRGDVGGSEGRSEVPEKVNRPSAGSYMAMNVSAVYSSSSSSSSMEN